MLFRSNKQLGLAPVPGLIKINLASIILANGLTDAYEQMASIPDWACDGPYAVYDDPEGPQCQALRSKVPTCQRLIQGCYNFDSRWTCLPAQLYCFSQLLGPLQRLSTWSYRILPLLTCQQSSVSICMTFVGPAIVKGMVPFVTRDFSGWRHG